MHSLHKIENVKIESDVIELKFMLLGHSEIHKTGGDDIIC